MHPDPVPETRVATVPILGPARTRPMDAGGLREGLLAKDRWRDTAPAYAVLSPSPPRPCSPPSHPTSLTPDAQAEHSALTPDSPDSPLLSGNDLVLMAQPLEPGCWRPRIEQEPTGFF